ncbi:MAG: two-component system response regulator, partial [Paracoccaceae bacterium]
MAPHVMLIEDEPNITEALRFILTRDGWQVSTHADGATALAEVLRQGPDV